MRNINRILKKAGHEYYPSYLDRGRWRRYTYVFITALMKQAKEDERTNL